MAKNVNFLDNAPDFVFKILRTVLASTEDPVGLARPLWRDYSRWQGLVNFSVAKMNGVLGFAARSTISWGYVDPRFAEYWANGGAQGLYRTSYHVIYPDQPVQSQIDNWYAAHPTIEVIPRVIDLEVDRGVSKQQIADRTWDMSEKVLARDGVRPIIYSRYLLINSWLVPYWTVDMLNDHYYWLAQYLTDRVTEHPGPPTAPTNVDPSRIVLHQTADKKPGFPGEVESAAVDWDRWELGDEQEMHAFIQQEWGGEDPPPPDPEPGCGCDDEIQGLQDQIDLVVSNVASLSTREDQHDEDIAELDERVSQLENNPPGGGGGGSSDVNAYVVTAEKTLARYIGGWNEADPPGPYPIIDPYIYSSNGQTSGRLRWNAGQNLACVGDPIRADGGKYFLLLHKGQNGVNVVPDEPDLFINVEDIVRI